MIPRLQKKIETVAMVRKDGNWLPSEQAAVSAESLTPEAAFASTSYVRAEMQRWDSQVMQLSGQCTVLGQPQLTGAGTGTVSVPTPPPPLPRTALPASLSPG